VKISLFVNLGFLPACVFPLDDSRLALATSSPQLTDPILSLLVRASQDYFPRVFVRRTGDICQDIPPVRNVFRPKVLVPLQRTGLTTRHSPAETCRSRIPAEKEWDRVDESYAVVLAATRLVKVVTHERSHKHKTYGRDDDDLFLYYHVETRRKCKTTFVGVGLLLNSTGLHVNFNNYILILLNVRFSTGR